MSRQGIRIGLYIWHRSSFCYWQLNIAPSLHACVWRALFARNRAAYAANVRVGLARGYKALVLALVNSVFQPAAKSIWRRRTITGDIRPCCYAGDDDDEISSSAPRDAGFHQRSAAASCCCCRCCSCKHDIVYRHDGSTTDKNKILLLVKTSWQAGKERARRQAGADNTSTRRRARERSLGGSEETVRHNATGHCRTSSGEWSYRAAARRQL